MDRKISKRFMHSAKEIMGNDPRLKNKLEKAMGKVADSLVKEKYLKDSDELDKDDDSQKPAS
ncbi:hypothetical protein [Maridesulfovibrio zosterae]|uniref:hypothetical protein n=1 Tax=Maridesulfovibrio zosterae TaxID=82171 RepID=UPI00041DFAE3|nr:hypothetical protein [Maridesulfovibrio zosterae]